METKTISILGTKYTIEYRNTNEDEKLEACDGYCDTTIKLIVIQRFNKTYNSVEDLDSYSNKVLRHELIHAILYECGLGTNSWADEEEIVDWLAIQYDKIKNIFDELGAGGD